jgi:hypothetical protein
MPGEMLSTVLRALYRFLVGAAALLIVYAVYEALRHGEPNPVAQALLVAVGALALASAAAVWSRHSIAVWVQVVAIPALATLYIFEMRQPNELEMLHLNQFWGIVQSRTADGRPFTIQSSPQAFVVRGDAIVLPDGQSIFPLSGIANLPTIMCREGARPFAEYEADEYGFNNPKGIWGHPVEIALIGDSMTYGACVANRDHFVAQLRERHPATLNLANGGIGPLIELAIMREFIPHIRPKYIFFVYDENNDLYFVNFEGNGDLAAESQHAILRKYLEDRQFSQRIVERHAQIDVALKAYVDKSIATGLSDYSPWKPLLDLLSLRLTRAALPKTSVSVSAMWAATALAAPAPSTAPPDQVAVFQRIFAEAMDISTRIGARLVFVNIPAQLTVCDHVEHPWKQRVLEFVLNTGADFIDLEQDFRNAERTAGPEKLFAVPPCGGHFSETGYKMVGDRLVEYLVERERLVNSGDISQRARERGWSFGENGGPGGKGTRAPAQVIFTETKRYESAVKFSALFTGDETPKRKDGVAILGNSYTRHRGGNGLRITVKFSALSEQDNEIVAALFIDGEQTSRHFATRQVKAGTTGSTIVTYETDQLSDRTVDLHVRVGGRSPGLLHTNADRNGRNPGVDSFLKIEELWLATQALHAGQLVYRGEPLSEEDLRRSKERRGGR